MWMLWMSRASDTKARIRMTNPFDHWRPPHQDNDPLPILGESAPQSSRDDLEKILGEIRDIEKQEKLTDRILNGARLQEKQDAAKRRRARGKP